VISVRMPLIFGEWMPMNEQGMYVQGEFLPFESDYFLQHAVYVKSFVKSLWQWIQTSRLPSSIHVQKQGQEIEELENSVYIRDNKPAGELLQTVLEHYRKFNLFY